MVFETICSSKMQPLVILFCFCRQKVLNRFLLNYNTFQYLSRQYRSNYIWYLFIYTVSLWFFLSGSLLISNLNKVFFFGESSYLFHPYTPSLTHTHKICLLYTPIDLASYLEVVTKSIKQACNV